MIASRLSRALVLLCISIFCSAASASEATVKALLAKKYTALSANIVVKKLGVGGLYEVNLLGQEAYTNEKVEFLLVGGSLIDPANLEDVTAKRKPQFLRDFFQGLPFEDSIKVVYGKGERQLVSFEDPDCPMCRAQHTEWIKNAALFNATVHTFMFPLRIHADARRKAEFIWCQPDPSAAWMGWLGAGKKGLPLDPSGALAAAAPPSCALGVAKVKASEAIARSLGYQETPRFIFANGNGANGLLSTAQFDAAFKVVEKAIADLPAPPASSVPAAKSPQKSEKAK